MAILLDTSAWIEFFQGTERGKLVKNVLKIEQSFTSIITFAEISNWCIKNNIENKTKEYIEGMKTGSQILLLNEAIIIASGKINYKRKKSVNKWGMMDSFILATSLFYNLKILTKDSYFSDLPYA